MSVQEPSPKNDARKIVLALIKYGKYKETYEEGIRERILSELVSELPTASDVESFKKKSKERADELVKQNESEVATLRENNAKKTAEIEQLTARVKKYEASQNELSEMLTALNEIFEEYATFGRDMCYDKKMNPDRKPNKFEFKKHTVPLRATNLDVNKVAYSLYEMFSNVTGASETEGEFALDHNKRVYNIDYTPGGKLPTPLVGQKRNEAIQEKLSHGVIYTYRKPGGTRDVKGDKVVMRCRWVIYLAARSLWLSYGTEMKTNDNLLFIKQIGMQSPKENYTIFEEEEEEQLTTI